MLWLIILSCQCVDLAQQQVGVAGCPGVWGCCQGRTKGVAVVSFLVAEPLLARVSWWVHSGLWWQQQHAAACVLCNRAIEVVWPPAVAGIKQLMFC